jgi:flagellar biogenesis protein FliO
MKLFAQFITYIVMIGVVAWAFSKVTEKFNEKPKSIEDIDEAIETLKNVEAAHEKLTSSVTLKDSNK